MSRLNPGGVRILNFESSSSRLMSITLRIASGTEVSLRWMPANITATGSGFATMSQ
jgi:hypothetical protein